MNPVHATLIRGFFKFLGGIFVGMGLIDATTAETIDASLATILDGAAVVVGAAFVIAAQVASYRAKLAQSGEAKKIAATVVVAGVPITKEIAAEKAVVKEIAADKAKAKL